MKQIKVTVNYKIPSWNFCNHDNGLGISKTLCRFCDKRGQGYVCLLYETPLTFDGTLVDKTKQCCKNTAGFGIEITEPEIPQVDTKELIKQTITMYNKTVQGLLKQGYPQKMAEQVAQISMLGNNK